MRVEYKFTVQILEGKKKKKTYGHVILLSLCQKHV